MLVCGIHTDIILTGDSLIALHVCLVFLVRLHHFVAGQSIPRISVSMHVQLCRILLKPNAVPLPCSDCSNYCHYEGLGSCRRSDSNLIPIQLSYLICAEDR